jgi:hypothetical protein
MRNAIENTFWELDGNKGKKKRKKKKTLLTHPLRLDEDPSKFNFLNILTMS